MKLSNLPISQVIVLIIGKLVGIMFASIVFSISFQFSGILELFVPNTELSSLTEYVIISSYSDLFMFSVVSAALLISLFVGAEKESKLTRTDIEKFLENRFSNFFETAMKLYGNSIMWLIFVWVTNVYILYNTVLGRTYLWMYLVVMILSISVSIYFYFDFDKEITLHKQKLLNNKI